MIKVTLLGGSQIIINADLIERVENMPETIITLVNGKKLLIEESKEEVIQNVINYKRKIYQGSGFLEG